MFYCVNIIAWVLSCGIIVWVLLCEYYCVGVTELIAVYWYCRECQRLNDELGESNEQIVQLLGQVSLLQREVRNSSLFILSGVEYFWIRKASIARCYMWRPYNVKLQIPCCVSQLCVTRLLNIVDYLSKSTKDRFLKFSYQIYSLQKRNWCFVANSLSVKY